jgi:peptidylprolyl isomerase
MAEAKKGDTVAVHYTGTLGDGTVFDSSRERDPLEFTLGSGQVIPGFDAAVEGLAEGASVKTTIACTDAYGERNDQLVIETPREHIPAEVDLEVGRRLQARSQEGQVTRVTVTKVTDDTVTLDANHPLAGQDLTFEIELVEIRAAA